MNAHVPLQPISFVIEVWDKKRVAVLHGPNDRTSAGAVHPTDGKIYTSLCENGWLSFVHPTRKFHCGLPLEGGTSILSWESAWLEELADIYVRPDGRVWEDVTDWQQVTDYLNQACA